MTNNSTPTSSASAASPQGRPLFENCVKLTQDDFVTSQVDSNGNVKYVKNNSDEKWTKIINAIVSEVRMVSDQLVVPVEAPDEPRLYFPLDEYATCSIANEYLRYCGINQVLTKQNIAMIRMQVISALLRVKPAAEDPALRLFKNGVVNVFDLADARPIYDEVFTGYVPHEFVYNPAPVPAVDQFMHDLTCGDSAMENLIWQMIGACFYNRLEWKRVFLLTGQRSCGKTTLQNFIIYLLGESNISTLKLEELSDRFNKALIFGKMAIVGDDIDTSYIKDTSFVKSISGQGRVTGEFKGKDGFSFTPYALPIFSCNGKPSFSDAGNAMSSRFVLIDCKADFSKNPDPRIDEKLHNEAAASYAIWKALIAYKYAHEHKGFSLSNEMKASKLQYEKELSALRQFMVESWFCLDTDEPNNERITTLLNGKQCDRELYYYYSQWLAASGLADRSEKSFRNELKDIVGGFRATSLCRNSPVGNIHWRLGGREIDESQLRARYIKLDDPGVLQCFVADYMDEVPVATQSMQDVVEAVSAPADDNYFNVTEMSEADMNQYF